MGKHRLPRVSRTRRGAAAATVAAGALTSVIAAAAPSFASTAPTHSTAPSPDAPTTPSPDYQGVEQALENVVAAGAPGAFAQVADAGTATRSVSIGKANLRTHQAPDPKSEFRTGSITKMFTSVLVLQLVADHKVDLDAPAANYLPAGVLPASWPITVRELLSHTSGLYDYSNDLLAGDTITNYKEIRYRDYRPADLVAMAVKHGLQSTPGNTYSYSNTNFIVLGMLIEHVTGEQYATVLNQRIVHPLGLTHTEYVVPQTTINGPHSQGYLTPDDRSQPLYNATEQTASWIGTAGALISNSTDLDHFLHALATGRLLPQNLLDQMETMRPADSSGTSFYGLGLREYKLSCGVDVIGHDGIVEGYQSYAYTTLDGSRQVTISANASNNMSIFTAERKVLDPVFCGPEASTSSSTGTTGTSASGTDSQTHTSAPGTTATNAPKGTSGTNSTGTNSTKGITGTGGSHQRSTSAPSPSPAPDTSDTSVLG